MWFILALAAGFLFAADRLIFRAVFTKGANPVAFMATHDFMAGMLLVPADTFFFMKELVPSKKFLALC